MGVSKTASTEEIKKRYHQLARKYHPDLNRGNKKVEQLFKEVNEAQEVLCDSEKRAKYDRFSSSWQQSSRRKSSGTRANVSFEQYGGFGTRGWDSGGRETRTYPTDNPQAFNHFASAFGGGGFSNIPISTTEAAITLTFSQAFYGSQQHLQINGETVKVRIPPGAKTGSRIVLRGKGIINPKTQKRGDLYLNINLQPHSVFKLQGNNIVCETAINPVEAVLGTEIKVPTIDGSAIVKVPPGINSGQSLRLKNKGWRSYKGDRGDHIVTLKIVTPKKLTVKEREYYEELRRVNSFNPRHT